MWGGSRDEEDLQSGQEAEGVRDEEWLLGLVDCRCEVVGGVQGVCLKVGACAISLCR